MFNRITIVMGQESLYFTSKYYNSIRLNQTNINDDKNVSPYLLNPNTTTALCNKKNILQHIFVRFNGVIKNYLSYCNMNQARIICKRTKSNW